MADTKIEARNFINELPVNQETKTQLLKKLDEAGVGVDLMVEIRMALVEAKLALDLEYEPQLKKLAELDAEEQRESEAAYKEYQQGMDELEKDTDALNKAVGKAMEQADLDAARKKLS